MTPEQPPRSSRHPRPGVAARRRALGLDGTPVARRESLRDSLARIPDLVPEEGIPLLIDAKSGQVASVPASDAGAVVAASATTTAPKPVPAKKAAANKAPAERAAAPSAGVPANGAAPNGAAVTDAPPVIFTAPTAAPETAPEPAMLDAKAAQEQAKADAAAAELVGAGAGSGGRGQLRTGGRPPTPMWRRVTFAVLLVGLIASIPVLGYAGFQLISDSKAGDFNGETLTPADPGYEAQVEPTPTAVAIQYDDQGMPNGVTFLSLSGADGGGAVIFVPLDTEVTEPSFGVDTLRRSYSVVADRPALARERLASQVGRVLNVGVQEIIDLGNAGWAQLVAPVAPLTIDNPDEIDLGFGGVIPTGETTLTAEQVGPYLAATIPGESDLNRLNRHEVVWSAWLEAVAASGQPDAVPGESTAGIAKFGQELAKGPVTYDTLPVKPGSKPTTFKIDKPAVNELITNTVAAPTAAVPGSRFTVRLLNGVAADAIPSDVVREVVRRGGAVTILGNGPSFGNDETEVVYANPDKKGLATLIATSMGATGKVRLDREAPDTVDLTIVLGKDILGDEGGSGTPGATTPNSTVPGD